MQPWNQIALSWESPIWSLVCVTIRRFSTDELSTYNPASHGFAIGLGHLRPTFLKRTRDFLSENINQKASTRIRGALDAIKGEKIPLANRISFKSPSTDELSTYIVASHAFIIGLRRLKLTFLKRTRDFLSENINQKASTRIRGELDAIKGEKRPLANRISFKSPMRGPKISSGLPGASRANGWA